MTGSPLIVRVVRWRLVRRNLGSLTLLQQSRHGSQQTREVQGFGQEDGVLRQDGFLRRETRRGAADEQDWELRMIREV